MKSIHFICRGNVYRSRLAEAYASSLLENKVAVKVSSSGIEAEKALNGDVDPDTVRLLSEEQLQHFLTPKWRQTSQNDIDNNDLVIFMSQTLYNQAKEKFNIPKDKVRIWEIRDIDGIYPEIKSKVNELIKAEL